MHPAFQTTWGPWVPKPPWEGEIWPGPQPDWCHLRKSHILHGMGVVMGGIGRWISFGSSPTHSTQKANAGIRANFRAMAGLIWPGIRGELSAGSPAGRVAGQPSPPCDQNTYRKKSRALFRTFSERAMKSAIMRACERVRVRVCVYVCQAQCQRQRAKAKIVKYTEYVCDGQSNVSEFLQQRFQTVFRRHVLKQAVF